MSYLETTKSVYKDAALTPDIGLCCTTTRTWQFRGLPIPKAMQEMKHGVGMTANLRDLVNNPKILYVGVGGGMELLQFSYFSRQNNGVIGVDVVDEMLTACKENFKEAELQNSWFNKDFVRLEQGDALALPLEDRSVDVAAQNCLFNIFKQEELKQALKEMYRVLKPHGRLVMSDPICEQPMNETLRNDETLRALCLSGSIPLQDYLNLLTEVGVGTLEVRSKRPYRILDPAHYPTAETLYIESVEVCAIKDPMPEDGACIFTGKAAIYFGNDPFFDDKKGHVLLQNQPLAVCDKTAAALGSFYRKDIFISPSTYHYDGGGCC